MEQIEQKISECNLSDQELIDRCNEWISKLAKTGGAAWTLRVPVDFNHDPDMLFCELAKRFKSSLQPTIEEKPRRMKCGCPCHVNPDIKHVVECCVDGWIELEPIPDRNR